MSNVINFAQVLNDRRAAGRIAEHAAAKAARLEAERREIAEGLGGTVGAHIIADVLTDLKAKEADGRPMPAYCDPSNERRGSKYEATKGLYGAELAKRIRADIKIEQKAGRIHPAFKISTTTHSYSGGYSIDVRVTAVPEGFRISSEAWASWMKQFGNARRDMPGGRSDHMSEEAKAVIEALEAIHGAYNRDNSDSMVDYFDTRFYGSVGFDWQLRSALEKAEIEASAGAYWHESAGQ